MSTQTTSQETTPTIDLSQEGVSGWEWLLLVVAGAVALVYLVRKFTVRKSGGCAGCGKTENCAVNPRGPL